MILVEDYNFLCRFFDSQQFKFLSEKVCTHYIIINFID